LGDAGVFPAVLAERPQLSAKIGAIVRADTVAAFKPDIVIEPETWPFADTAFDLVISVLQLHWINDAPGAMIQMRRALRPDGLCMAAFFGEGTLSGWRDSLLAAETLARGGAGLRIAPMASVQDGAALLQRAGFALPVADVDRIIVRYRDPLRLVSDLRGMGESAAFTDAAPPLTRTILAHALARYQGAHADAEGRTLANFDVITATGWAPHQSQQKPLAPGSAKARLADALGVTERSAGETAGG
jgi:SAM-dependent methyltransferase